MFRVFDTICVFKDNSVSYDGFLKKKRIDLYSHTFHTIMVRIPT